MVRLHGEKPFDEEEYERVGGVFVPVNGGREVGCEERCAPDDLVEDSLEDHGVPGTPDDLPYDYGVETAEPADLELLSIDNPNVGFGYLGRTGPADEDAEEPTLGRPDERELWRRQRGLIQESGDEAARWGGLEASDLRRVEDAIGDDAAEVLPESPEGESATGAS